MQLVSEIVLNLTQATGPQRKCRFKFDPIVSGGRIFPCALRERSCKRPKAKKNMGSVILHQRVKNAIDFFALFIADVEGYNIHSPRADVEEEVQILLPLGGASIRMNLRPKFGEYSDPIVIHVSLSSRACAFMQSGSS
jgi:hypothetical protein